MATRNLKVGDVFLVNVDPLSLGGGTYYRAELEVLDVQTVGIDVAPDLDDEVSGKVEVDFMGPGCGDADLDIAVCRILHWVELKEKTDEQVGEEDLNIVGQIETLVRAGGKNWQHTQWLVDVDFREE